LIVGIGSDLIDIRRIERTLERFGERFTQRVFTEIERTKSDRRKQRAASYAKRFAAKEACSKALGSGVRMGVAWREMGVVNLKSGKPTILLSGGAETRLARMVPAGFMPRIDVTITDDFPFAQAFVVIPAWPADWPGAAGEP
jgi:holo-[acyl-carrier protein] synthase